MALTRSFKEMVQSRVVRDPDFGAALLGEGIDTMLAGDVDTGKAILRDAERHRAGLRVGTAITEGTANFLVNRRMNKSQQMRWSRRGAGLLLQVRCAVYNGTFGSAYG